MGQAAVVPQPAHGEPGSLAPARRPVAAQSGASAYHLTMVASDGSQAWTLDDSVADWIPLRVRSGGHDQYLSPHEGVPPWLMTSLLSWIERTLRLTGDDEQQVRRYVERMERTLRRWVLLESAFSHDAVSDVMIHAKSDAECVLDVIDYILDNPPPEHGAWESVGPHPDAIFEDLESILREAGSIWTIRGGGEHVVLVKRTTPGLAQAATRAMTGTDPASQLLAQAWRDAFGRSPDPEDAYATAIKAVEAAAKPTVLPSDEKATLSKMAKAMLQAPSKWTVRLDPDNDEGVRTVAALLRLLMRGHEGRHGSESTATVDQRRAEAAVETAVVLVQWFRDGVISPS